MYKQIFMYDETVLCTPLAHLGKSYIIVQNQCCL